MSRIRTIKPDFFTSEQIVECSPIARLLFIGLWCFADDGGVHPANPKRLKMEVFPGDEDITIKKVASLTDELVGAALLVRYTVEGVQYLEVTGWKHQKIDRPTLRYPSSNDQRAVADQSTPIRRSFDDHSTTDHPRKGREGKGEERSPPVAPPARPSSPDPATERAIAVGLRCLEILGHGGDPTWNWAPVHQWLADGADPERDIFPALEAAVTAGRAMKIRSLGYFTAAITEAIERRKSGSSSPPANGATGGGYQIPEDPDLIWRLRVETLIKNGRWLPQYGPKPWETGTDVPAGVREQYAQKLADMVPKPSEAAPLRKTSPVAP